MEQYKLVKDLVPEICQKICDIACAFSGEMFILLDEKRSNCNSIMSLLSLGAKQDDVVSFESENADLKSCFISELIKIGIIK